MIRSPITLDRFALHNARKIVEKSKGTVTLSNGILMIKIQNPQQYVLRGWHDGPNGTVMVLNGPWYEEGVPARILSDPEYGTNQDKRWLRKR